MTGKFLEQLLADEEFLINYYYYFKKRSQRIRSQFQSERTAGDQGFL